jgi:tetratricopeptide (TPR) repeat protein
MYKRRSGEHPVSVFYNLEEHNLKKLSSLLIILVSFPLFGQASFDSLAQKGISEIYNIKFEEAEVTFREMIADYPEHPAGRFFLAMIDWWKILLDLDNESYDDIFFQKLEDVIYQCDEILSDDSENVDALFFKGGAIGFRGRLRAYRESWIKAADDGREALPIVERASFLDPDNVDVQLGFGIYNYYASVIPDQYPLIKPLMIFFPSGDKAKGIEQLAKTASEGKYARYEARYFLMTLFYNNEGNFLEADKYADMLISDFPDNPTFQRWKGRIAVRKGNYPSASEIFSDIIRKAEEGFPGYNNDKVIREAAYYIAVHHRNINEPDSAKKYFSITDELSQKVDREEESGFLINSVLYLGMVNDQLGLKEEARKHYSRLLKMREYGASHSLAKEYLKKE